LKKGTKALSDFFSGGLGEEGAPVRVLVDTREAGSPVLPELQALGVQTKVTKLDVGDYVASQRVCVERKTCGDLASSIVDGRLFEQVSNLAASFERPIVVLEGWDIYSASGVLPQAVWGAILSVVVDQGVPALWSKSPGETAGLIHDLARREQAGGRARPRVRSEKKPPSLSELQLFLVAGLPSVERILAKRLLLTFKTPEMLFRATARELQDVEGIGEVKARRIREALSTPFREPRGE